MATEDSEVDEVMVARKLNQLKDDVDEIFSAFESILCDNESSHLRRRSVVEKEKMALLRQYLKQSAAGGIQEKVQELATSGQAKGKNAAGMSGGEAADLVQRVTDQLEGISQELVGKVEEYTSKNRDARSKNIELQVALENHQAQYSRLQTRLQKAISEMNVAKATCETLRQQVTAKNEEISRLRRQSNIVLWEREKKRVLRESLEREAQLLEELESTKERIRDMKERTHNRLRKLNEDLKREKMRAELRIRKTVGKDDPLLTVDDLQRQLFLAEKKLATACDEIRLQQRLFVGVLGGLKRDYRITLSKWEMANPSSAGESLAELIDLLHMSAAAGTLDSVRTSLPTHYQGLAKDITGAPARLAMLQAKVSMPTKTSTRTGNGSAATDTGDKMRPMSASQYTITKESMEHSRMAKRILSASPQAQSNTPLTPTAKENGSTGESPASDFIPLPTLPISGKGKRRPEGLDKVTALPGGDHKAMNEITSKRRRISQLSGHPELVNLVTGLPNIKEAVNLFPELTEAQVRMHFSKFMMYDKSQDYTLDKSEVLAALSEIYNEPVEMKEFEAAFKEVDLDGSGSVDFYEYLSLHRILAHNSGQADMLKDARKLTARGSASKACIVQ